MSPTSSAPRLPAIAAACLLSVALPAIPAVAKEKVKSKGAEPAAVSTDYAVSIPTIDAVGSSLDRATLNDILSGNIAEHADALATLDATSITVPEITVVVSAERDGDTNESTITLSDFTLENVVDGVARSVSLGGIDLDTDEGAFTFGTMTAASFNLGGMLGLFGLVDNSGSTELETVYTNFTAEGGSLDAEEVSCTFGAANAAEFKARPMGFSFADFMILAEDMEEQGDDVDPALTGQFIRMYADILTAFEMSGATYDGLACEGLDDDGETVSFEIGAVSMGRMAPGTYPEITMEGFTIAMEGDGSMALDGLTIKQTDLSATIAALQAAPARVDDAWFEANARSLIPAFEGLSFAGLSIDIPDSELPDSRIQADVGAFDLSLTNYINGIPGSVDISATNIQAAIPGDSGDETFEQLRALGVTDIDAGFRFAASWDEATNSIALEEVSISGADLATITLAGTIANATKKLFASEDNVALAAAMGLAVKSLDLSVVDAGLSDIVIAAVAAEQNADPATLRPVFAGLAQGTIISMLAGAADAAKLGEAVNAFVSGKARTLEIGIDAKADPGLTMFDFIAAEEDPASLLGKVNVSATSK